MVVIVREIVVKLSQFNCLNMKMKTLKKFEKFS
jgi:hypothetical protein